MRFTDRRRTILKTGEPLPWVLAVVTELSEQGEIPATPHMAALDKLSPERPFPEANRKSRREGLKGREGRWNLNGNEPHWRRHAGN